MGKPTHGRDKRLVIGSGYPFVCLRRFSLNSYTTEFRFAQGAMQSLKTLQLKLRGMPGTLLQSDDYALGLENLSSLEHINIECILRKKQEMLNLRNAIDKEIDMNPNKPKLNFPENFVEKFGALLAAVPEEEMRLLRPKGGLSVRTPELRASRLNSNKTVSFPIGLPPGNEARR